MRHRPKIAFMGGTFRSRRFIALIAAYVVALQALLLPLSVAAAGPFAISLCSSHATSDGAPLPADGQSGCPCAAGCGMLCCAHAVLAPEPVIIAAGTQDLRPGTGAALASQGRGARPRLAAAGPARAAARLTPASFLSSRVFISRASPPRRVRARPSGIDTMFRLALIVAAACAAMTVTPAAAHDYKVGALKIGHPWARATPKGASVGAGYLSITNTGTTADRLVGGTADVSKRFEVHEMKMDNGVMKMRMLAHGLRSSPARPSRCSPAATTSCSPA